MMDYPKAISQLITEDPDILELEGTKAFVTLPDSDIKPGTVLKPSGFAGYDPEARDLEILVEKIRKEEYPSRPSRINAVFVAPTEEDARAWQFGARNQAIYRVVIDPSADFFQTDGATWTEARSKFASKLRETASGFIREYWEGGAMCSSYKLPELIVQGKVTVTGKISQHD